MLMKSAITACVAFAAAANAAVQGFDVSHWQPSVNFAAAYSSGARFVYIKVRKNYLSVLHKATEP